jgi:PAS domain S-box-containing protein
MQYVADKWYIRFTRGVTFFAALFLAGSIAQTSIPVFGDPGMRLGLSPVTLVLSAVALLYRLTLYRRLRERSGLIAASLILCFIFMMILVSLIHSTGQLHSWYHGAWIILVFWSGIFGPYAIIGFCFLTSLYLLLIATDVPGQVSLDPVSIIAALGVYLIGFIAHMVWKRRFIDQESAKVAQLSGALKSKQQQAEILIQSLSDGIIVTDTEGKINLMNPAASKITGWPLDEAVGIGVQNVMKLSTEKEEPLEDGADPFKKILTTKEPVDEILLLTSRDNRKLTVSLVISPVLLPNSQEIVGSVAVMRDISAKRAEEQRRADFISTASHEMRTPVAAIEGYLALAMNDKVSQIDAKARNYLEKAHSSTQHLGQLFQDLLTSAKAEDGRLVSHPVVVEMGGFLEQLADSLRFSAEKKGLLMEFVIGVSQEEKSAQVGGGKVIKPLYYVHVDPDRLREVITNLFDNAVKYTDTGKVTLALTGNIDVVQLYIKDTGPGIPAEDVPHLFQKFYRVDNSATRSIGGTGLGLFICRKIIELYKGRIWVESTVGQGSTFYINLPRLSAQKAAEMQASQVADAPSLSQI